MSTREDRAWAKCQAAFRRNKAESKTWQEYSRMNQKSWAEYEEEKNRDPNALAPRAKDF